MTRLRLHAELLACERHNDRHNGNGALSHVIFGNGSVASIPMAASDLLVAVAAARMEKP